MKPLPVSSGRAPHLMGELTALNENPEGMNHNVQSMMAGMMAGMGVLWVLVIVVLLLGIVALVKYLSDE
jgi:hypothetical protein